MALKAAKGGNAPQPDWKKEGIGMYEELRQLGEFLEKVKMTGEYSGVKGLDLNRIGKEAEYVDKMKMAVIKGYGNMKYVLKKYAKSISSLAHNAEGRIIGLEQYAHDRPANIKDMLSPLIDEETLGPVKSLAGKLEKGALNLYNILKNSGNYGEGRKQEAAAPQYKEQQSNPIPGQVYAQAQKDTAGLPPAGPDYREGGKSPGKGKGGKGDAAKVLTALMFVISFSFLALSVFNGAQNVQLVDSLGTTGMFIAPSNFYGDAIWSVYTDSIGLVYVIVSASIIAVFGLGRLAKQW